MKTIYWILIVSIAIALTAIITTQLTKATKQKKPSQPCNKPDCIIQQIIDYSKVCNDCDECGEGFTKWEFEDTVYCITEEDKKTIDELTIDIV